MHAPRRDAPPQDPWLRRHRVAYELGPVSEWWDDGGRRSGFELMLFAQAPPGADPGSDAADAVWHPLAALAASLVPEDVPRDSRVPRPYRAGFVYRPETGLQPELRAALALYPAMGDTDRSGTWRRALEDRLEAAGIPRRLVRP